MGHLDYEIEPVRATEGRPEVLRLGIRLRERRDRAAVPLELRGRVRSHLTPPRRPRARSRAAGRCEMRTNTAAKLEWHGRAIAPFPQPDPEPGNLGSSLGGPNGLDLVVEMAHDLRSPLTSILFLTEALQRG